jgi:hypothetical protein
MLDRKQCADRQRMQVPKDSMQYGERCEIPAGIGYASFRRDKGLEWGAVQINVRQ